MKDKIRTLFFLFSIICLSNLSFAQTNNSTSGNSFYGTNTAAEKSNGLLDNWYFGLNGGGTIILATLREKPYSWAVGASFGKQMNSKFDIQLNLLNGKMHSEGFYSSLFFVNDVNFTDASLILKLKLKSMLFKNSLPFINDIYVFGGYGFTFFNSKVIKTDDNSFFSGRGWVNDSTKTSKIRSPFIPLGAGLSFNLDKAKRYQLTAEFTYHYSSNNELDGGFSSRIGMPHSAHYVYTSLGFIYNIGMNASSPEKVIAKAVKEKVQPAEIKKTKPEKPKNVKVETSESKSRLLNNWYAGVNAGMTTMLATLRDKPNSWGVGAVFGNQLNRKIAIQANLLHGKLHSEGLYGGLPLINVVNFTDASLLLKLNLNDIVFTQSPKIIREFYLFGGAGLTFFNSKVNNSADLSFVTARGWANDSTKTSNIKTPFIPIGIGLSFNLGNTGRYHLTTEFAYHFSSDNELDGGLTTHAGHYTYGSVGLVYKLGKQTALTQQLSSDAIEEKVTSSVLKQVKNDLTTIVQEETKPIKEELSNQSKTIASLQAEVESRINDLNNKIKEGVITTQLPDGSIQTTPINGQSGIAAVSSLTSIYFAFNSLYLTPDMQREIAVIAKMMKKNRKLRCEITGNASNVGSPEYNLMLSQKRSEAVAAFLSDEFGIDSNRLIIKSNGITDPLAKNLHKINRRVDMQLFW